MAADKMMPDIIGQNIALNPNPKEFRIVEKLLLKRKKKKKNVPVRVTSEK